MTAVTSRAAVTSGAARQLIVGVGECAVSGRAGDVLVAPSLGSCMAVCLWDGHARVGVLLHVLLPDSRIHPARARLQPSAFADTAVPLLFELAREHGVDVRRSTVWLVGGLELPSGGADAASETIGARNASALRRLLAARGVEPRELVGGSERRSVRLSVADGSLEVKTKSE